MAKRTKKTYKELAIEFKKTRSEKYIMSYMLK